MAYDFQRFTRGPPQQTEFIAHPAILAALGAETIFVTILARRQHDVQSSDDSIRVRRMQPVHPEPIVR
jgi:hypothetical protein